MEILYFVKFIFLLIYITVLDKNQYLLNIEIKSKNNEPSSKKKLRMTNNKW